jgi:hypothetical protein
MILGPATNVSFPGIVIVGQNLMKRVVVMKMKTERGLALQDLLSGAYEYFETLEFPPAARVHLLDKLATIEYVLDLLPFSIRTRALIRLGFQALVIDGWD